MNVWILTKDNRPWKAFASREELDARMERVSKANSQYPTTTFTSESTGLVTCWTIGPVEDEGFFGNKPKDFHVYEMEVLPS